MSKSARERPVVLRDVGVHVAGLPRGHGKREEAVVRREVRLADPPDVLGLVQLAQHPPLAARRHAVGVDGADAGILQTLDCRVRVVGRIADVRPVEQRRDTPVESLERTCVIADVHVLGAEEAADLAEHDREVVVERANGRTPRNWASATCGGACRRTRASRSCPRRRSPRPRRPTGRDRLRRSSRRRRGRHRSGCRRRWVHRDDEAVTDQQALSAHASLSLACVKRDARPGAVACAASINGCRRTRQRGRVQPREALSIDGRDARDRRFRS